jgi:sphinganine-1-phosphate aldolase
LKPATSQIRLVLYEQILFKMLRLLVKASSLHLDIIYQLLQQTTLPLLKDGVLGLLCSMGLLMTAAIASIGRTTRFFTILDGSILDQAFRLLRSLPVVRRIVRNSKKMLLSELSQSMKPTSLSSFDKIIELPPVGKISAEILLKAKSRKEKDYDQPFQSSRMTGTIYATDFNHRQICNQIYSDFAHTNPLHSDAFPSIARMESEIVNMAASFLGGDNHHSICGTVTSGGTESILTAVRTSRDFVCYLRNIDYPEMIVATSAHAAVYKAAEYFKIKIVRVPVNDDGQMMISAVKRSISYRTVLIYASAPTYPHGVVDPIEDLSVIALKAKCCLHVDACLGGFVLPFISDTTVGNDLPNFDFSVAGVTSLSVDTHKYGFAQKGSSILLYSTTLLRQFQYTSVTDWTGGLYISPTPAGSRSGGLIAQTWASMLHMGRLGYINAARDIFTAVSKLRRDIEDIEGLCLIGKHVTMVVSWRSVDKHVNIYDINDILSSKGWRLAVLQNPSALHICVTAANILSLDDLVRDLRKAVASSKTVKKFW